MSRLSIIYNILKRKASSKNALSLQNIKMYLQEYEVEASRNTIKSDINKLKDFGIRIKEEKGRSNKSIYYLEGIFEESEIRIILDSIHSNRFINNQIKKSIEEKLLMTKSYADRKKIRNLIRSRSIITGNIDVMHNIFLLNKAIEDKRYIKFNSVTRDTDKKFKIIATRENIIPIGVFYEDDRYYLICFNSDDNRRNYRVDRMASISLQQHYNKNISIDLDKYPIDNFSMFVSEEAENVEFLVKRVLINSIVEKFSDDARLYKYDDEWFRMSTEVGISKGLIRWILKQGADIKVIYPEKVKNMIRDELKKLNDFYNN